MTPLQALDYRRSQTNFNGIRTPYLEKVNEALHPLFKCIGSCRTVKKFTYEPTFLRQKVVIHFYGEFEFAPLAMRKNFAGLKPKFKTQNGIMEVEFNTPAKC